MHTITFTKAKTFGELSFAKDRDYLVEDHNAAQFMIQGDARVNFTHAPSALDRLADLNGSKLLIVRCGAAGDLLMLTPTLREIKRLWPDCRISVATFSRYRSILEGNPHIDGFEDYPLPTTTLIGFQKMIFLENAIETHPDARAMPIIDALAARFGIHHLADHSLVFRLTEAEKTAASVTYPRGTKKRVGIQCQASAAYKSYPKSDMDATAKLLYQHGWEVFLFGNPGEINAPEMPHLVNVTATKASLRQSAAIAATCDVILAPDSLFVHLAAALDVPCVALYGPFPADLYTRHYPKCVPLSGTGECSPCFHHPRGTHYPTTGPCWRTGRCEVLADINPRRVVRTIEATYERFHQN